MKFHGKHTYKFNPHTLKYEKVFVSLRDRLRNIGFSVLFGVVLGVVLVFVGLQFLDSPKERSLEREVATYRRQSRVLNDRVDRAERVLEDLEERDNVLYRTIFESEPLSDAQRRGAVDDDDRYSDLEGYDYSEMLIATTRRVDELSQRLYAQSKSLDEIYAMALSKNERMASMPAIFPVDKKSGKVVSGYGMRFHPIMKYMKMHSGIDITARQGTPVYATGDGVVREAGHSPQGHSGYGNVALIDHGFGFETLYAHLNTVTVRPGQRVKRGQQIGTVGASGMTTGSHLHYEVILNGNKVDPVYYFSGDLTPEEYEEVLELARQQNQCMS